MQQKRDGNVLKIVGQVGETESVISVPVDFGAKVSRGACRTAVHKCGHVYYVSIYFCAICGCLSGNINHSMKHDLK